MKRMMMCVCILAMSCSPPSSKQNNTVVVNNGNNANNQSDAGANNANNISDVNVPDFAIDEDGPQFVDLSVTPSSMTEGGLVTVLVQLTDPQGFDDIGGGRVLDLSDNVYGNFDGSGGSYSIDISWDDVTQFENVTFDTEMVVSLVAEFFDGDGHLSRRAFDVTLECGGDPACEGTCGEEDCNGMCQEVFSDENACGACDNMCNRGEVCENETTCLESTYLASCNSLNDCTMKGNNQQVCDILFQDDPVMRCAEICDPNDPLACGFNPCVSVGNNQFLCFTDCTDNANLCTGDLTCSDVGGGVSACLPPVPAG